MEKEWLFVVDPRQSCVSPVILALLLLISSLISQPVPGKALFGTHISFVSEM